jgi:hypothetical protein
MLINGDYMFDLLQRFVKCMEGVKAKLSTDELNKLRSDGKDIRRYLIDTGKLRLKQLATNEPKYFFI